MSSRALRDVILRAIDSDVSSNRRVSGCLDPVSREAKVGTTSAAAGRPFFDGEQLLLAPAEASADWLDGPAGGHDVPDDKTRDALARAWLRDAQLEHASIASFARFTLQLLALGAPPELIAAAQRATLDEVEHAQACFGLASRFAGRSLGPGELPMPSSLGFTSLADAAASAVHEACVAETLAARLAFEQLQHASDARAHDVLIRIATDETRHAALGYQFVRWALASRQEPVRVAVQAAFARASQQLLAAEPAPQEQVELDIWHAHGRLSASEQRAIALQCLREVIEPCASSLLAGDRRARFDLHLRAV
jgi:hypothetical protein